MCKSVFGLSRCVFSHRSLDCIINFDSSPTNFPNNIFSDSLSMMSNSTALKFSALKFLLVVCSTLAILAIACHRYFAVCGNPLNFSNSWPAKYNYYTILACFSLSFATIMTALKSQDLGYCAEGMLALVVFGSFIAIICFYVPCVRSLSKRRASSRQRSMVGHNARVRQAQRMIAQMTNNANQVVTHTCQQPSTMASSSANPPANCQLTFPAST